GVACSSLSSWTDSCAVFALGLPTIRGVSIWTRPVVAAGQFIIALNFAEVTSHYPIAGSVFQWTKYLARRGYAWFNGWIYLFAGILTVTAVVATIPIALIPSIDGLPSLVGAKEWTIQPTLGTSLVVALITLVV